MKSRHEPEDSATDDRERERKREHRAVEPNGVETRQIPRRERHETPNTEAGQQDTGDASREREDETLREQLPRDASATRAQGRADRQLGLSRGRASKGEAGHVHAGNEQNESDRAKQNEERTPYGTDELFMQRDQPRAEPGIVPGILTSEPRGNRCHLGACAGNARGWSKPGDDVEPSSPTRGLGHVPSVESRRQPEIDAAGKLHIRGRDADDLRGVVVERDHSRHDV